MNLSLCFVRSSSTRFQYIYREELDDHLAEMVGTLRLQKLAVGDCPPHRIRVRLDDESV